MGERVLNEMPYPFSVSGCNTFIAWEFPPHPRPNLRHYRYLEYPTTSTNKTWTISSRCSDLASSAYRPNASLDYFITNEGIIAYLPPTISEPPS